MGCNVKVSEELLTLDLVNARRGQIENEARWAQNSIDRQRDADLVIKAQISQNIPPYLIRGADDGLTHAQRRKIRRNAFRQRWLPKDRRCPGCRRVFVASRAWVVYAEYRRRDRKVLRSDLLVLCRGCYRRKPAAEIPAVIGSGAELRAARAAAGLSAASLAAMARLSGRHVSRLEASAAIPPRTGARLRAALAGISKGAVDSGRRRG